MTLAFVFEPDRCTGCEACRVACGIENGAGRDTGWRTITTYNPSRHPAQPTMHLSLACNHCATPACALGCPAAAYHRDDATGAVVLDPAKCIGCRYCSWLCPYDAPKFDEVRGVMTKCTLCAPRVANGAPACAAACPTAALSVGDAGDRADDNSDHFPGLGSFGLGASLRIEKTRRGSPPQPAALAIDDIVLGAPRQPVPPRKITLRSEWALLLFTIVMPALVAWFGAGVLRPDRKPPLALFLVLGAVTLALSSIHLGKPLRAWRAVLNLRSSWLSREIVSGNLFLVLGAAFLAIADAPLVLGAAAVAAGIALAVSIDGVYRALPGAGRGAMHSSEAVPTTIFLLGIAAGVPIVTIAAGALKAALFGARWAQRESGLREPFGVVRMLLLGLACTPNIGWPAAFASAIAGEILDRIAFYSALEPTTPQSRISEEFSRALRSTRAATWSAGALASATEAKTVTPAPH